ncbi:MAG: hypothetical protein CMN29_14030, partial [Sandaracinus sp.]|nr:hypothetical protein [Sandaracinus sp.]
MNRPLLSALALLALACGEPDAAPPPAPDRSAPPSARHGWARVHAPGDATLLRALGRVVGRGAAAGADVGLPFPAHVRAVHVAPGDRVEAGAPLVEVLAPELALAVAEARGARAELAVHAERLANLRTLRGENLVRASALHEVEHAMAALRSRLGVAEARLRSAGVGPAERRELSARGALTLKSPVDGTVRAVDARLGAAVDEGL